MRQFFWQLWKKYSILVQAAISTLSECHSVMSNSLWPLELYSPWNSPGHNTGVGSSSLLQGIFPTHGSNPGLLNCRRILYHLSHQGRWLINNRHLFLTFCRLGSLRSRHQQIRCPVKAYFLVDSLSTVFYMAERLRELCVFLFLFLFLNKGTNPTHKSFTLMTESPPKNSTSKYHYFQA